MHSLTVGLARASARHPWRVLAGWLAAVVLAVAGAGALLGSTLTTEGTVVADVDAKVGFELLEERVGLQDAMAGEAVVVRSESLTVDDAGFQGFTRTLVSALQATGEIEPVPASATSGDTALVSMDRHAILLPLDLADTEQMETAVEPVIEQVQEADEDPDFSVSITGTATLGHDFLRISENDLRTGESIGLLAALVILVLVFGALVAGLVPLAMALVCIPVTLGIAAVVGQVWDLSFFIINMVVAMGLALGIDYSLFVVSRYREERRGGRDRSSAIEATAGTASVAVLFSGSSFTVALVGLLLVPDTTLRSLAAGAIIIGVVTVLAALSLLPAVLAVLGDRVDALRVPFVHSAVHEGGASEGDVWRRVVHVVMARPAVALLLAGGLLLLLAVPVIGLQTGMNGTSSLPDSATAKQGALAVERDFPSSGRTDPARLVVDADPAAPEVVAAVARFREEVERSGEYGASRLEVFPEQNLTVVDVPLPGDPNGEQAKEALRDLRSEIVDPTLTAAGVPAYVTGTTAFNVDYADLISAWLPVVIAFVLAVTFVLLTLVFRSVVLPLKAVLLNLLSVGAAYGLLVLVFQEGYGAGVLGLTQVEAVEPWVPVFLFSVLFALSMDYHVFLLSRIRERYLATGRTTEAVAEGIASTGRLITGAALIIVVVFSGFAAGDLIGFQQMGFGVAVALLLDATLVRSVVVPSSMALLGQWNWYLPRWLEWLPELQVEGRPVAGEPEKHPAAVGNLPLQREPDAADDAAPRAPVKAGNRHARR
jgi:putative drug exporter of the RND superfamily